jgi:hypothetical protein
MNESEDSTRSPKEQNLQRNLQQNLQQNLR